jgi:hypothetical protein
VDAQVAAGDLPGARQTMRAAVEARMAIYGRSAAATAASRVPLECVVCLWQCRPRLVMACCGLIRDVLLLCRLCHRHLVVAKSLTRLARLLMAPPPDPEAAQLAPQLAANAVSIAEAALQVWWGGCCVSTVSAV